MAEEYIKNIKENMEGLSKILEEKGLESAANTLREKIPYYDSYIELLNARWESNPLGKLVKDRKVYEVGSEVFDELSKVEFAPWQARHIAERSVGERVGMFRSSRLNNLPNTLVSQLYSGGFLRRRRISPGKKGSYRYGFVENAGDYLKALSEISEQELKNIAITGSNLRRIRTEMEKLPEDSAEYRSLQEMSLVVERGLEKKKMGLLNKE